MVSLSKGKTLFTAGVLGGRNTGLCKFKFLSKPEFLRTKEIVMKSVDVKLCQGNKLRIKQKFKRHLIRRTVSERVLINIFLQIFSKKKVILIVILLVTSLTNTK